MSRTRIAHLSDPHFGTVYPEVQGALLTSLTELSPDVVLISGDITQRARRGQFQDARLFRELLGARPFFAVPGNHDIPLFNVFGRFTRPYHGFHTYFQTQRETTMSINDVGIIGLNSTSRWRHIQGKLNLHRIREAMLNSWGEAKMRVAMVHHPLACLRQSDNEENRLRDLEATQLLFREARVDLVLSGHVHAPFATVDNDMVISTAGTCLSWRTRADAPNSFHRIDVDTELRTIEITRHVLRNGAFQAAPTHRKVFLRTDLGWTTGE